MILKFQIEYKINKQYFFNSLLHKRPLKVLCTSLSNNNHYMELYREKSR